MFSLSLIGINHSSESNAQKGDY